MASQAAEWKEITSCANIEKGDMCFLAWNNEGSVLLEENPPLGLAKVLDIVKNKKSWESVIKIRWYNGYSYNSIWKPAAGKGGTQEVTCESVVFYQKKILTKKGTLLQNIKLLLSSIPVAEYEFYETKDIAELKYQQSRPLAWNPDKEPEVDEEEEFPDEDVLEEDQCILCGSGVGDELNPIVICSDCGVGYHLNCHPEPIERAAIDFLEVQWHCYRCNA